MTRKGSCLVWRICLVGVLIITALKAEDTPTAWPPPARDYRFHMIGHAHIDPVWLWSWPEGLSVVHSTFRSALDRMNETPGFAFTSSSAQFYEWVAESDPKMLAEIRRRVEEGRWAIVGGWWVEPDVNIPSGESLARHGLYGQAAFRRLFGRPVRVAFNPDSFGHAATVPQILKLQGMDSYVFMRPMQREKNLPADLFWWEGADGTRLLTYRIPFSYNDTGNVGGRLRRMVSELKEPPTALMAFYGVGDHGGGPTKLNIESILSIQKQPDAPKVLFSTPERYIAEIRQMGKLDLPVVRDELQIHAVGCYTAQSEIKKNNRQAEFLLVTAEKMASLGSAVAGVPYPQAEFAAAWKKVLFQQFHDILAGTSLPEHYAAARDAHGYAMEVAIQAMYRAAQKIAWEVPATDPDSKYLVVFNPHPWAATLNTEYDLDWPPRGLTEPNVRSRLEDERGSPVAHQWTQGSTITGRRRKLVFQAPLPAFGYRQFRLRAVAEASEGTAKVRAGERELENEHLRVTFTDDGTLAMFDKDVGQLVFQPQGGARAVVLNDPSDTWSHDVTKFTDEIGAFGNASFRVLESGPLRAMVRVRSKYGNSSLETDWILYAGSRNLEARVTLDWHERLKMLKFSFPAQVNQPRPTFEVAFGHIVRRTDGDEVPGHRWADLGGSRGGAGCGLAVINDAKYGYSAQDSDLRITVARSAVYAHHQPHKLDAQGEYIWQDQGRQSFRMLLVPHARSWQEARVIQLTEEFTTPAPVIYQGIHPGQRPLAASFLSVDSPQVIFTAVKKAENSDDLIVRCYEAWGQPARATLDLKLVNRRWTGEFRPFEIKTLRVPRPTGTIREVNLLEE